jgi:hypothetical protein
MKRARENKSITFSQLFKHNHLTWGRTTILLIITIGYFSAGASKIIYSEGKWFDGSTLSFYMSGESNIQTNYFIEGKDQNNLWKSGYNLSYYAYKNPRTFWGEWLIHSPNLLTFMSSTTILFEILSPLALLGGVYNIIILLSAILFHLSADWMMGIEFLPHQIFCLILLDWNKIKSWF